MKLKLLTLIPMIGLTSASPVAAVTTSNTTNVVALNANKDENKLEIGNKLSELLSINKSCDGLFRFFDHGGCPSYSYSDINTMISVESAHQSGAKDGKIERDDLFNFSFKANRYETYCRYKSNHVERSNITSWGNAKKYQLNVTVPANTKEYKVQVVAKCKLKNCVNGYHSDPKEPMDLWCRQRTFMQGNLSKLSTDPNEMLMPSMGTTTDGSHKYSSSDDNKIIRQDSYLYDYYQDANNVQRKPHIEATLTKEITLSNEKNEPKVIPVYFWYGFFGGGYTGHGAASHINCSEVWFSANHIA